MTDAPWGDGVVGNSWGGDNRKGDSGISSNGVDVVGDVGDVNNIGSINNVGNINNKKNGSVNTSNAKKASIEEDIKKEPIIQTIIDIFDGEVLS